MDANTKSWIVDLSVRSRRSISLDKVVQSFKEVPSIGIPSIGSPSIGSPSTKVFGKGVLILSDADETTKQGDR
jgi:hypothetical protein